MTLIEGDQPFTLFLDKLRIQRQATPEQSPHVYQPINEVPLPLVLLHTKGGNHKVQVVVVDFPNKIACDARILQIDVCNTKRRLSYHQSHQNCSNHQ